MTFNGKVTKKTYSHVGVQLTMSDRLIVDAGPAIKEAMSRAIKSCSLSRDQIVDEMNRLASSCGITCNGNAQKVTLPILDKWLAPGSLAHIIPLRMLPIFCRAVGSNAPLDAYAEAFLGVKVIAAEDHKILEWGRAEIQVRRARKRQRQISIELGIE